MAQRVGARLTGLHVMMELTPARAMERLVETPPEPRRQRGSAHADKLLSPFVREAGLAGAACDTIGAGRSAMARNRRESRGSGLRPDRDGIARQARHRQVRAWQRDGTGSDACRDAVPVMH